MANKEWLKVGADGVRFCERLEDLIKLNKTTAIAISKETGVAQSAISGYINGGRAPDCASIIALARHFGVSTDYLLGLSSVKTPSSDLKAVIDYTGLSEDNVGTLNTMKRLANDNGPFAYNAGREATGEQPYLDLSNDLLDALFENRDTLTGIYYLLRSASGQTNEFDIEYCKKFDDKAYEHGCTILPSDVAARLYCTRIGGAIERYLAQKYIDGTTDNA